MKSIFGSIFLRFSVMIALSFLGIFITRTVLSRTGAADASSPALSLQLSDALGAFERGGPQEAASYLGRLKQAYGSDYFLLDNAGRDVITGASQAELLEREKSSIQIPYLGHTAQRRSADDECGHSRHTHGHVCGGSDASDAWTFPAAADRRRRCVNT